MIRRVEDGERFVRGLAGALPEAFADIDLRDQYDYSDQTAVDSWARTIALADAVQWIETNVVTVDRDEQSTLVHPDGSDSLHRFFEYMETVIHDEPHHPANGWIMVELFEGIPWVEDVIDRLGPRTVDLLRYAQGALRPFNGWIGRWSEGPPAT